MTGKTRRCEECKEDISQRGRAAKRCKPCDKLIRQQRSIEHQERRAELKAISGGTVTRAHINGLLKKQHGKCANCDVRFWGRKAQQATIDHHIPIIRGGAHDDSNIKRLLCRRCNSSKGAKSTAEWEARVRGNKPDPEPSLSTKARRAECHVTIRFRHPDNVADVRKAADRDGLSMNAWIVNLLTDATGRLLKTDPASIGVITGGYPPPVDYDEEDGPIEPRDEASWDWETGAP